MHVARDEGRGLGTSRISAVTLAALMTLSVDAGVGGERCDVYVETFDSFLGPHDLTTEQVSVQWCVNGANVVGGSFCPSGNALRLVDASDDPVVHVQVDPGSGCTHVTLRLDYSQFPDTLSYLQGGAADTLLDCSPVGGALVLLDTSGGICTSLQSTLEVPASGAVFWQIEHGPLGGEALLLDNVVIALEGCCGGGHGCCDPGIAGCDDPDVQACVCDVDPFCCDNGWDQTCVEEVTSLGCGTCGPPPSKCIAGGFATDFGTLFEPGTVCALLPELFESCEGVGPFTGSGTDCGGSGDQAMRFGSGFPHAAAITHCLDLSSPGTPRLSFSWAKQAGTLGPAVAISADEQPFQTIWSAPISPRAGCHEQVLDLSAFREAVSIRLRFSSGSSIFNGATFDDIELVFDTQQDCCEEGSAGCADDDVSACVCAIDPYCCLAAWDELCVIIVEAGGCGDCGICVDQLSASFDGAESRVAPCDAQPVLFIACDGPAVFETAGSCAARGDWALRLGSAVEPAAVVLRCIDLGPATDASLQFQWSRDAGGTGPFVDASGDAGATFVELWAAPRGDDPACRDGCVDLGPAAGLPFVLLRLSGAGVLIDDIGLNTVSGCPDCPGDVDGSGETDAEDLLAVINAWSTADPAADVNDDATVDVDDLLAVINGWGPC